MFEFHIQNIVVLTSNIYNNTIHRMSCIEHF